MQSRTLLRKLEFSPKWLIVCILLLHCTLAWAAVEVKFDLLQIGTASYTNATVTSRGENYVMLIHDGGMASIKVADLPPNLRWRLGYGSKGGEPADPRPADSVPPKKIEPAAVARAATQDAQKYALEAQANLTRLQQQAMQQVGPANVRLALGLLICCYLFYSYCLMLICRKAGGKPGLLVWIPVIQYIPAFLAAGMSWVWCILNLVPGINLIAYILWCFKIARARGKSSAVGFLLLFPLTSLFAFLYLAFSDAPEPAAPTFSATATYG